NGAPVASPCTHSSSPRNEAGTAGISIGSSPGCVVRPCAADQCTGRCPRASVKSSASHVPEVPSTYVQYAFTRLSDRLTSCSTVSCEASATTFGHVTTDAPRSVVGWAAARCEAAKAAKQTTAKRRKVRTTVPISLMQALDRLCQAELDGGSNGKLVAECIASGCWSRAG